MGIRGFGSSSLLGMFVAISVATTAHAQQTLVVDGMTVTLSGEQRYDHICVINGGMIVVDRYDGGDKSAKGNLELLASTVYVDDSSAITARGRGYQAGQCQDGDGPNATGGGRGGCAVWDSGGGGAHFGGGGRGTVDLEYSGTPGVYDFHKPYSYEDDCDIAWSSSGPNPSPDTGGGGSCAATSVICGSNIGGCPDGRGGRYCRVGNSVAGQAYWHNIYDPDFGAAGGDKGCNDGDGKDYNDPIVGGHGGGRVVIAGLSHLGDGSSSPCGAMLSPGQVQFDGLIDAGGKRGCGDGNDSGGGGAGGTLLVVGEQVAIGDTAVLSVAGALGGDTNAKNADTPWPGGGWPAIPDDCASNAQNPGGTCDDCGGGGGGGIISVLSVDSSIDPAAQFDVSGASGGTCPSCQGEAGGGAGELQLDGAYVGEFCDGFDNDFDGMVDEGLGTVDCGYGSCQVPLSACDLAAGEPNTCMPMTGPADCEGPIDGARARISIVLDSSASMLLDLSGNPTFGDGSIEQPGLSTDGDGMPNDSRMFLAREAVAQVVSAYPEIDFSLSRYHQDQALARACQTATWFECQDLVASYDDPTDNGGAVACTKNWGNALGNLQIRVDPSPPGNPAGDEECINYAGSCGPPRRGADVLSGFGSKVTDLVRWLDGQETNFIPNATPGDVCDHSLGGDCELRATGPTPLAGSLLAMEDYIGPFRDTDPAVLCRGYSVILVTDGAESCNGDPAAAAQRLHDVLGLQVYVIAVSVLPEEEASLNAIARAGSGNARDAIPVNSAQALVTALTQIIAGSIRYEDCNNIDDDCDGLVDEDFPGLGDACDDGALGVCLGKGSYVCNGPGDGIECVISMPGGSSGTEVCNELDDDCDGGYDEGLTCLPNDCVPLGEEICNGLDDDCMGGVDDDPLGEGNLCGQAKGECEPGRTRCVQGMLQCFGAIGPMAEVCDGDDDDCDGMIDNDAKCPNDGVCFQGACRRSCNLDNEFPCPFGQRCEMVEGADGTYCIPDACAACTPDERCEDDTCIDRCEGVSCGDGERCEVGQCVDCHSFGCEDGELCVAGKCQPDACADADCADAEVCVDGTCQALCTDGSCGAGKRCGADGCETDPCAEAACNPFQFCDEGSCRDNVCSTMRCVLGDVCVPALGCVDDPCAVVSCPAGRSCAVTDRGTAQCLADDGSDSGSGSGSGGGGSGRDAREAKKDYVSSSGASNFGCAVGAAPGRRGAGGLPLLLMLAVLGLRRRRSR